MVDRVIVINRAIRSLSDTSAINDLEKGEWFLATDTKTIHWKNPTSGSIEPISMSGTATGSAVQLGTRGTVTINASQGNLFYTTINGNTTLNVSNYPTANNIVTSFVLDITNGGAHTVSFWPGIQWEKGIPPTLSSNRTTTLAFVGYKRADQSTYTWKGTVVSYEN